MIQTILSTDFLDRKKTSNTPILSLCRTNSGISEFYIKHVSSENHYAGLLAELICSKLAKSIGLYSPEVFIVEFGQHAESQKDVIGHLRIKSGLHGIASKLIPNVLEISKTKFKYNKHEFNRILNPSDLIKILLFDLWIGNRDRLENNYNLLLSLEAAQKIIVFDHFDAFLSIIEVNDFKIIPDNIEIFKGLAGSMFGQNVIEHLTLDEKNLAFNEFFQAIEEIHIDTFIDSFLPYIPQEWNISLDVLSYIGRFLKDQSRLNKIREQGNYLLY